MPAGLLEAIGGSGGLYTLSRDGRGLFALPVAEPSRPGGPMKQAVSRAGISTATAATTCSSQQNEPTREARRMRASAASCSGARGACRPLSSSRVYYRECGRDRNGLAATCFGG